MINGKQLRDAFISGANNLCNRKAEDDEIFPWDVIDCGVTKAFLLRERDRAYAEKTTPNCREKCSGCGANKLGGERSWCSRMK